MSQLTVRVRLRMNQETATALLRTMDQYTGSFNRCCKVAWEQDRVNGVELHHSTYYQEREITDLPAQLVCSARVKATEAVKGVKTARRKATKSKIEKVRSRTFKCPESDRNAIRYDARSSKIDLRQGRATLSSLQGRQKVWFRLPEYYGNRLDWKVCSADLVVIGRKFHLHVVVEKEDEPVTISNIVGIDLGVKRPAVTSSGMFLGQKKWREINQKYFRLKRALQAKGTKSAKRHLKRLSRKENRFRQDCDHVLSKQLVTKHPEGTLFVLEDLTNIRQRVKARKRIGRSIHSWSFARLKFFLEYKAKLYRHAVDFVDPRYTSQKCSQCNHIDKKNRKTQSSFLCRKCGFQCNADLNASFNVCDNYLAGQDLKA